ncbi:hypothetical protein P171DRAFT_506042 [Karstenula rhodostoma CBS 690.94]|uniref:Uncharacterized protein n=1 Tax=Karstenula rhodostoma CBS 690.94 TaxID=1392251 RepID=A0A9P4P6D6_9PLEO|nr:hypothetical protein P171DRAFT_506042 [Karstenula rhodostoma CBS 690.94]
MILITNLCIGLSVPMVAFFLGLKLGHSMSQLHIIYAVVPMTAFLLGMDCSLVHRYGGPDIIAYIKWVFMAISILAMTERIEEFGTPYMAVSILLVGTACSVYNLRHLEGFGWCLMAFATTWVSLGFGLAYLAA